MPTLDYERARKRDLVRMRGAEPAKVERDGRDVVAVPPTVRYAQMQYEEAVLESSISRRIAGCPATDWSAWADAQREKLAAKWAAILQSA